MSSRYKVSGKTNKQTKPVEGRKPGVPSHFVPPKSQPKKSQSEPQKKNKEKDPEKVDGIVHY